MSSGYTTTTPAYEWMVTTIEQATGMEYDGKGETADRKHITFRFYCTTTEQVLEYELGSFYGLYESCKLKLEAQAP